MIWRKLSLGLLAGVLAAAIPDQASAQSVETVGSRALGMGGAFVAVANDSSATWWNPSGLATGPFLDIALGRMLTETNDTIPGARTRVSALSLGTPPLGLSYYRLQITEITPLAPIGSPAAGREEEQAGVHVRSLTGSQFGVSLLQSVFEGVTIGSTVKYVRGTLRAAAVAGQPPADDLLDLGEDLSGGEAEGQFDLDLGVMATGGAVRVGMAARNLFEPEFTAGAAAGADERAFRMPRQVRVGIAYDGSAIGKPPLTIAFDADVMRYDAASGERRVLAVGAEHWLLSRRIGLRGGARFNMVGAEERAATGGASVALRRGLYVDGYVVGGGPADERGWGVATRVSF